ncbi:hypothetical protein [Kitasatospora phosalacinea]|uniref:Uncharacterized protein n=1 Tax=Kitasatospora phosalacinea TaxID=2065 RepID=A0A9W6PPG4_9ACTN|nr:hypothetical protein [Kitasatospora phosalacinea]GLW58516.1 hypothetical protein Kpho01_65270 [Kitasatospora phosalacinea]
MTESAITPIGRVKHRPHARMRPAQRRRADSTSSTSANASTTAARTRLVEWHTMTVSERLAAWAGLCDWVIWLYDRYELAVESRLPQCWAEHPGLIEELWALKVWREEIYTAAPDQQVGQAARYWHAELRAVVASATGVYATSCRTGHRGPDVRAADSSDLQKRWTGADPWAGIPGAQLATHADTSIVGSPDRLVGAQMDDARARGLATPLSPSIPEYVRYTDTWWAIDISGDWLRVVNEELLQRLEEAAARMAAADEAARRYRDTTGSRTTR